MERLSKCEEEIFLSIQRSAEAPGLKQVMESVNKAYQHEWKPQTVSTFIQRLVKKGYLKTKKEGRSSYYYSTIDLDAYRISRIQELKENLFNGDELFFEECAKIVRS